MHHELEGVTVVVAHHTPDLYGSDRQMLESVRAMVAAGARVVVCLPTVRSGPLVPLLEDAGATVDWVDFPVLRKASISPTGLPRLAWEAARAVPRLRRAIRRHRAGLVYVNTLIIPWWPVAARLAGVPAVCHVHETPDEQPALARTLLVLPLLLCAASIVNSRATARSVRRSFAPAARRTRVVYNGVGSRAAAAEVDASPDAGSGDQGPARFVLVGRVSPRKGTDVALEALAELVSGGRDATLDVVGSTFEGYEWFEDQLRARAERPDLRGRVRFLGYRDPTAPLLDGATAVLVPSREEPFGNTAVEGQRAGRLVIAAATGGLPEVLADGDAGRLVAPGSSRELADAMRWALENPAEADRIARLGHRRALDAFSTDRYARDIVDILAASAPRRYPT